jgi:hypothetical protein
VFERNVEEFVATGRVRAEAGRERLRCCGTVAAEDGAESVEQYRLGAGSNRQQICHGVLIFCIGFGKGSIEDLAIGVWELVQAALEHDAIMLQ